MGERKHKAEGGEKKDIHPSREEGRQKKGLPGNHLKLLLAGHAKPADI